MPEDDRRIFYDFDRAIVKAIRAVGKDMVRRPKTDEVQVFVHHRTFDLLFLNPNCKGVMAPDGHGGWTWRGFQIIGVTTLARDHVQAVLRIEQIEAARDA